MKPLIAGTINKNKIKFYILHYNRPDYLVQAVNSALVNGINEDDIVILDNGSDELKISAALKMGLDKIEWRFSSKNNSRVWNFLRCFEIDESDYFIALHDDDFLDAKFINEQINFLDKNPSYAALSCNGYRINEQGVKDSEPLLNIGTSGFEIFDCPEDLGIFIYKGNCFPLSPTIYRRSIVDKYKQFISNLVSEFDSAGDVAFFCKILEKDKIALNKKQLYFCRLHSGQHSAALDEKYSNKFMEYLYERPSLLVDKQKKLKNQIKQWQTIHLIRNLGLNAKKGKLINLFKILIIFKYQRLSINGLWIAIKKIFYRFF
jgi:glycosyltransferase involved in cell wall biosynthesis